MQTIKHSKQRDAIVDFLRVRTDHPTADVIYQEVKKDYPNISLATVYRNLTLLNDIGEIRKLTGLDGADHFDGNIKPHYHFLCRCCNHIFDLHIEDINHINTIASCGFDGEIEGHFAYFYGKCAECKKQE